MGLKLDKLFCGFCYANNAKVEKVKSDNGCNIFAVICPCGARGGAIGYSLSDKDESYNDALAQDKASTVWRAVVGV